MNEETCNCSLDGIGKDKSWNVSIVVDRRLQVKHSISLWIFPSKIDEIIEFDEEIVGFNDWFEKYLLNCKEFVCFWFVFKETPESDRLNKLNFVWFSSFDDSTSEGQVSYSDSTFKLRIESIQKKNQSIRKSIYLEKDKQISVVELLQLSLRVLSFEWWNSLIFICECNSSIKHRRNSWTSFSTNIFLTFEKKQWNEIELVEYKNETKDLLNEFLLLWNLDLILHWNNNLQLLISMNKEKNTFVFHAKV